ncbi:MAG TPA: NADH-quinone oxidoreductase subunit L [Gemmataceae bacterium]|nr:NADH-quinone oxidoreductase subunit L [Gemmataceae bacterium]
MSDPAAYLWLIPVLPLAAFVLTAALGPRLLRGHSHWPCVLATVASFILSAIALTAVANGHADSNPQPYYTWFHAGDADIGFTLRADALSVFMAVTVTFIASFIAIYSIGYMHGDEGYARYFAEVSLFVFAMTGLVLADNFLVLFAFWEGVGLCSYLLIGFWFTKPSAAQAARKAFLVTRLGDLGFILGVILLWITFGHELGYEAVFARAGTVPAGLLTAICLLLFCGAVGKSAQFPLHVWLPDAMEGPSPVSALIHAATMVTAGVYMVARCMPLFQEVPVALLVVGCTGALTALLAALIALTQNDLKRVLAYSTVSQLGYMFLALGSATALTHAAVVAAIFHLFTHAFFKALLFLAAGSVMHAMGNVIDMRRFGGLRHELKTTHWTFLFGALALSGFPLFAGFWSKDEILAAAYNAGTAGNPYYGVYVVLFISGIVTAGLTAFYTFRAYFLTFWGETRIPHEAGEHAHESPPVMLVPLVVLAAGALLAGYINAEPLSHWLHDFLGRVPHIREVAAPQEGLGTKFLLMLVPSLFAIGGIAVAWWMYIRQPGLAGRLAVAVPRLYQLSLNKFYLDELYAALIVAPLAGFAQFCRIFDLYVVDGIVDILGQVPRLVGFLFRPIQNGLVQFYGLAMIAGLAVFLIALVPDRLVQLFALIILVLASVVVGLAQLLLARQANVQQRTEG